MNAFGQSVVLGNKEEGCQGNTFFKMVEKWRANFLKNVLLKIQKERCFLDNILLILQNILS